MATNRRGLTQRQLCTLFDVGTVAGLTDGQLLERFATRRDEGAELAFAALVERHGPMVLHVSRSIVRNDHEAMDVFQATFLVLARKGRTLWVRESLGPWLHRVACRAAARARKAAARRRTIETRGAARADPLSNDRSDDREELAAVIHEEVNRLPERFRSPVVLCDLEGCTCEEAARHLGCPVGTVASRLARARQRLRTQLRGRGLAPNSSLLAASLRWRAPGGSITAELAGSTARAAVQFLTIGAVSYGPAASLALEVVRAMALPHVWNVASLFLVLIASASGVAVLAGKEAAVEEPHTPDPPGATRAGEAAGTVVKPGPFRVNVQERGTLEAVRTHDAFNRVEGQSKILFILPQGTRVKKGELVCELDSAALRDQLTNQSIATSGAEAAYQHARLAREVTETALKESENGNFPQWLQAATSEITEARSAMTTAEELLKQARTARDRVNARLDNQGKTKNPADVEAVLELEDNLASAQRSFDHQRLALQLAQAKRDVLEKFTRDTTVEQLRRDLEQARTNELAKGKAWDLEKNAEAKIQDQIAHCKFLAAGDGVVVHANTPRFRGRQGPPEIAEGATIRERQKIFSIPEIDGPMRVNTKVHESLIGMISPGLTADVDVDAFPGVRITGIVDDVAPLPDPKSIFSTDDNIYSAHVTIAERLPNLRPGMTALVDMLVADLADVLTVPTPAIVWYDEKDHVAVRRPDHTIDWREVTLGLMDVRRAEVKEGLQAGETVVTAPSPLLTEEQKQKILNAPSRPVALPETFVKLEALPAALRAKLQTLGPEARIKLQGSGPNERPIILEKAGFTDDEIRRLKSLRPLLMSTPR